MSKIYLVQSASDLSGSAGYCKGLLESETRSLLVSFMDYRNSRQTILPDKAFDFEPPKPVPIRRRNSLAESN